MGEPIRVELPLTQDKVAGLHAGDSVLLSGVLYTGRDAAHKKMVESLDRGEELPFDVRDQVIYFVGPTPPKPGQVIGSAGPTTSGRMDAYSPKLIERGLTGMIGKGLRSPEVIEAMKNHGAVYFGAIGGSGALLAKRIISAEVIAYPELGTEAVRKLVVKDFPVMVVIDQKGNNLYELGKAKYRKK
ncbi:hydro-lyase family enzyme, Fe-S type, tartrate/fumarate subfamily [Desulfitobacterium dichloroeliminans LMG P-21439]|uniref:Hydro-lyase family enzyme, Fe-S type, tartrate/fumarate subfamily n=1 Tax=Desulfitobacterium dichloroeliminans (strain LMG P-21439 / DCA1) TaxID=871963 RepID=L0FC53_DESDL|nr:Fe-S-containing hydro-lyase [Desulfitobacterium dichloroeliminans]AGA70508.1 hydro-lyase family enzyme, Fe-S type, tartrate/fumarate subfamily [Desulfitobacterium dichloroeliminans LMG P-21439]